MPLEGQWRPFPKVPHLLQYVSNDNYYARIRANGKRIRESLETGALPKRQLAFHADVAWYGAGRDASEYHHQNSS